MHSMPPEQPQLPRLKVPSSLRAGLLGLMVSAPQYKPRKQCAAFNYGFAGGTAAGGPCTIISRPSFTKALPK
jgi:hypothetical protein